MTTLFQNASESLERYQHSAKSCAERWRKDHDSASRCLEFEELLVFGMAVYHHLNNMDELWRLNVHRKKITYDPKMEKLLTKLYRNWLNACGLLTKILEAFEKADYEVAGAADFRAACREVAGLLTPDDEFFSGDKFLKLQEDVLHEHRAGQTKEIRRLSD